MPCCSQQWGTCAAPTAHKSACCERSTNRSLRPPASDPSSRPRSPQPRHELLLRNPWIVAGHLPLFQSLSPRLLICLPWHSPFPLLRRFVSLVGLGSDVSGECPVASPPPGPTPPASLVPRGAPLSVHVHAAGWCCSRADVLICYCRCRQKCRASFSWATAAAASSFFVADGSADAGSFAWVSVIRRR